MGLNPYPAAWHVLLPENLCPKWCRFGMLFKEQGQRNVAEAERLGFLSSIIVHAHLDIDTAAAARVSVSLLTSAVSVALLSSVSHCYLRRSVSHSNSWVSVAQLSSVLNCNLKQNGRFLPTTLGVCPHFSLSALFGAGLEGTLTDASLHGRRAQSCWPGQKLLDGLNQDSEIAGWIEPFLDGLNQDSHGVQTIALDRKGHPQVDHCHIR